MTTKTLFLAATVLAFLATLVALAASVFFPVNALIPLVLFMVSGALFVHLHGTELLKTNKDFAELVSQYDSKITDLAINVKGGIAELEDKLHKRVDTVERVLNVSRLK